MRKNLLIIILLPLLSIGACSNKESILLGATTTLEDSGILSELITAFEQEHQIMVKPIIAGSGQIHELIKRGDIDTAITHDPAGEQTLLTDKAINARTVLMRNDYLLVGPTNDPAHIKLSIEPEEALQKINFIGALFISRNDNSGTHQMETRWWKRTGTTPTPKNYVKTGAGMGATLAVAIERDAYTIVDRGTWLNFSEKKGLKILFEDPDLMPNQYSILSFGEDKAKIWEEWLLEDKAQQIILNYRINNQPVFFKKND